MDDCIIWEGDKSTAGYGEVYIPNKGKRLAHREVFYREYGYYPAVVMHLCDNPLCVNINHLKGGTQLDNMRDCATKWRTHKPRGEMNGRAKLKFNDVVQIKIIGELLPRKKLAGIYDVDFTTIRDILKGKTWKHVLPSSKNALVGG